MLAHHPGNRLYFGASNPDMRKIPFTVESSAPTVLVVDDRNPDGFFYVQHESPQNMRLNVHRDKR